MTRIDADPASRAAPRFGDLVATFAKIGLISFGGAAGQIALMHTIVVDEKKWLDERRFQHALSYCMLLPGPEAQQLATYIGWLTHGVRGGLAAGLLFVVPGAAIMLALSGLYVLGAGVAAVEGLFFGIKAAVLAIVLQALLKIARRGLTTPALRALAALAFAALLLLDIAFPLIVVAAAAIGALLATLAPPAIGPAGPVDVPAERAAEGRGRGAAIAAGWCLLAWWAPVGLAALVFGGGHLLVEVGLFFSKLAVLTFGGAYAVLAWLAQSAVELGWVTTEQMIDGLGLAETTPGPTILVNQFVAFLAGQADPAPLSPFAAAILAALMATWVTFAPSFLWIFVGAPFVDDLRRSRALVGALAGITAAVVGVIGFIALWFALHVLFGAVGTGHIGPLRILMVAPGALDVWAAGLALLAAGLLFSGCVGLLGTVALLAGAGLAVRLAGV